MLALSAPRKPAPLLAWRGAVVRTFVRPDAFGNALGESIKDSMQSTGQPQPAGAVFNWDEADMDAGAHVAAEQAMTGANNRTALNAANVAADPSYYSSPTPEQSQEAFRQSERDYCSATERSVAGSGYVAQSGDSVSRIVGSSDPQAIGNFMRTNGLSSSSIEAGRNYFRPDEVTAYGDSAALGQVVLNNDNARLAALAQERFAFSDGRDARDIQESFAYRSLKSRELTDLQTVADYQAKLASGPQQYMSAYDPAAAQARGQSLAQTRQTLAFAVGGPVMTGWAAGAELAGAPPEVIDNLMQAQTGLAMAMVGGRRSTLEPVDMFPRNGVGVSTSYAFNALENPGPLASLRGNPAGNFYGGRYDATVLSDDLVLFRAGEGVPGKELGQWFTRVPPNSVAEVRIDSAVKPQWINPETGAQQGTSPIDTVYAVRIPQGATIYEGPVGSQGGVYVGGPLTNQIYVHRPWDIPGVKVLDSTPLR